MAGAKGDILTIDIGGTKVGWAFTDADGLHIGESQSMKTLAHAGGADVARRIRDMVVENVSHRSSLLGIGIASAGVVDPNTGAIVSATDTMPGWAGTELGAIIREATGLPVHVINDVHAHGLGEAVMGAGKGATSVLSMALGTGIGGALIRDGRIDFGDHFLAGHYGHIHHYLADSLTCSCGRRGHIEAIASGHGITNWYNSRRGASDPEVANGKELQDLADSGNELARAVFNESAFATGETLATLANCIDPSVIVLSGSMTRSGAQWWDNVGKGFLARAMDPVAAVPLKLGELDSAAPLYGAAINFLRKEG
ncbi:ROK family protein [Trueperella pyogenes]|uniref:ROK family protein n=1 Tax=Trueperella pyogenes TaxID=1661 RepID=UPI000C1B7B27|nr:ROK family protein [Trueperella pyogenes]MBB3025431.1 glucokinase [Trueperella pyogenes]PIN51106.1 ROK family protein [Trueperella pyogenes]WHU58949.1 ROK family protein [Trueperella pyogenes]SUO87779.1 Glucokinase [Trueperella pyogenes]